MVTNKVIIDNLNMYLQTLIEQNIYYCSLYKEYKSPSHSGYVRALDKSITSFHRRLQTEDPIGRVEDWVTKLESVPNENYGNTERDYEEYEAYMDKLYRIKGEILEILNGE